LRRSWPRPAREKTRRLQSRTGGSSWGGLCTRRTVHSKAAVS
jgi:hypothetical protein